MIKSLISVAAIALLFSACGGGSKPASKEDVAKKVTEIMCDRMAECTPSAAGVNKEETKKQCKTMMGGMLKKGLEAKPDLKISTADLDKCVTALKTTKCEDLSGGKAPAGCEALNAIK